MKAKELFRLLRTAKSVDEVNGRREEIAALIPLVEIMFDFEQKNSAHQYDLWFHSLHVLLGLPRGMDDNMLYLAALLHDIGKPDSVCKGKRPDDTDLHYYGHPKRSVELVRDRVIPEFRRCCENDGMKFSTEDWERLLFYVEHHDDHMGLTDHHLQKYIDQNVKWGDFRNLMLLEVADAIAHVQIPIIAERADVCRRLAGPEGAERYSRLVRRN